MRRHLTDAARGSSHKFHRAIRKYGPENFSWAEVEHLPSFAEARQAERFVIGFFGTDHHGYNSTSGGEGSSGVRLTEEVRGKISAKLKCWYASGDPKALALRAKVSAVRRSTPTSAATRRKMSEAHLGHTLSEESRAKLSRSMRKYPDELVAAAVAYARAHGFRAAERRFGIARPVISRWAWSPEKILAEREKMRERARRSQTA